MMTVEARLAALEKRMEALEKRASNSSQHIVLDKELDRVLHEMSLIKDTYASHQSWSRKDRDLFADLKKRRDEIRTLLGIKY